MDPLTIAGLGISGIQAGLGFLQSENADDEINALKKKRRAYKTPEEVFDVLQATQSRASSGFDPATLEYLTGQTDQAFGTTIQAAKMLGADPNTLGANFTQKVNSIIQIGAENAERNMANFLRFLNAKEVVAANDAAEQKSREDMLKDDIQAAAKSKADGVQNVGNAINSGLGFLSSELMGNLYGTKGSKSATAYYGNQGANATSIGKTGPTEIIERAKGSTEWIDRTKTIYGSL